MIKNNTELVKMISPTAHVESESDAAVRARRAYLQEIMNQIGPGKKWANKDQAWQALRKDVGVQE